MILTRYNFEIAQDIFMEFSNREIPIMFLGAGADEYSKEEAEYVAGCLKQLKYVCVITRDDRTYEMLYQYEFLRWRIAKGIDAAFFVSDLSIPRLNIGHYDVECFDRIVAPYIQHENEMVIYTHHDCFGKLPMRYINKKNTLISELPYDYLTLYRNVDTTYSERVHACIVTWAFGKKARLYVDTPRMALFDRVLENGAQRIREEAVGVDEEKLKIEKERMVRNAKTFYEAFVKLKCRGKGEVDLLQVYIETISSCNRKCNYCYYAPGSDASKNGKRMSIETFKKIIDDLAEFNYANLIYLYDINEPLLDKRMPDFIRMVSEKLPKAKIYIFSNGDLADVEIVRTYFENGLSHFVFSLHDHSNEKKIRQIIEEIGSDKFTIADMTILKTEEFMNRGGSIKSDKIASQETYIDSGCWLPFRQTLINPDGDFRLCCSIRDEVLFGNVHECNIMDYFYNNEKLNEYRGCLSRGDRHELFPCKDCSFKGDNEEGIKIKLGTDYEMRQAIYTVYKEGIV